MAGLSAKVGVVNDFELLSLTDQSLLHLAQKHVSRVFGVENWMDLKPQDFHVLVSICQGRMNAGLLAKAIAADLQPALSELVGSSNVMVQSNLYLRAARPCKDHDAVNWHRESFYGCQPEAFNIWMPVLNVIGANSIRYIPGSADIPDEEIITEPVSDGAVEKGSDGHKIGLLYAPKRIIGGVDLPSALHMPVPIGKAAVFKSSLIHGAGWNFTDKVRFSIDFRVIAKEHVKAQKKSFAGDGQDFFVPLREAA